MVAEEADMTGRKDSGGYSMEEQRGLFPWRSLFPRILDCKSPCMLISTSGRLAMLVNPLIGE